MRVFIVGPFSIELFERVDFLHTYSFADTRPLLQNSAGKNVNWQFLLKFAAKMRRFIVSRGFSFCNRLG